MYRYAPKVNDIFRVAMLNIAPSGDSLQHASWEAIAYRQRRGNVYQYKGGRRIDEINRECTKDSCKILQD
jgi:hypothetical protein